MPDYRVAYAPSALLLAISTPAFGQAQGQVPPGWTPGQSQGTQTQNSQSQQGQDQHRRGHGQHQPPQGQPQQGQGGVWNQRRVHQGRSSQVQSPPVIQNQAPVLLPQGQSPQGQGGTWNQRRVLQGQQQQTQAPPVIQNQPPVLSTQGQPPQGQGGTWNQRRVLQGQQSQTQAPPVIQNQPQVLSPQGQPPRHRGSDQMHRRNDPAIQVYRGPDNYRSGSLPSITQRRNQQMRNRDWYRQTYRAQRRYRLRSYVRPRGWYLYDWVLGDILPSLFWTRDYRIVDYWRYGLPIPPDGCIWVRYDHDALLIDEYSGEVVEVIYDIFY